MRVLGASCVVSSALLEELAEALHHGRPALLWSDGPDVMALIGEAGDTSDDVVRLVPRCIPELRAAP